MIVMKFGGTSVGTADRVRTACAIVKEHLDKKPFVVVSAHNSAKYRMTDTLIDTARQALFEKPDAARVYELQHGICADLGVSTTLVDPILETFSNLLVGINMIGEISPRTMDLVMSFGERMSCLVFAEVMNREFGVAMKAATAMDLGLKTDGVFGAAKPDPDSFPAIRANVAGLNAPAVVTTGFIGEGPDGHITTLGRGGSDYSATIFAAALEAEEVEIWTDVDGVMSADPKICPGARSIPELSFAEASELAWFGAKVLHPATMAPAIQHNIPVRVLNTHRPEHPGTAILSTTTQGKDAVVKSIAHKDDISLLTVTSSRMLGSHGFMSKVFEVLGSHQVDIHMIATSEVSISLTTSRSDTLDKALEDLEPYGSLSVERGRAMVSVVGEAMAGTPGVAKRVCGALATKGINIHMISQGACEFNMALLVDGEAAKPSVAALHEEFFGVV